LEETLIETKTLLRTITIVAAGLIACLLGQAAQAATVIVGTCKPGVQYPTISAAVAGAPAGSTIDVCPGTYTEQVVVTKNFTIIGITVGTADSAVLLPPSGGLVTNGSDIFGNPVAPQIFVQNAAVTISHLTVDGTGNNLAGCGAPTLEGIYYQNSSGTITDNVVRNQYQSDFANFGGCQNGLAINVESLTDNSTVAISNNFVQSYQKNGVTATGAATGSSGPGPSVTITGNYIVGLGANALNWGAAAPAAENGVQFGFGASGKITGNIVIDDIWPPDTSSQSNNAASGILVYASAGISVLNNDVGSTQFGIVAVTDPTFGPADGTIITGNKVTGTQIFDAIDLCSNGDSAQGNFLFGNTESGIHADSSCGGTGTGETIKGNTISGSCAGVLNGGGGAIGANTYLNVTHTILSGDVCPAVGAGADAAKAVGSSNKGQSKARPSPYVPAKK
jgi:hypothetical protein